MLVAKSFSGAGKVFESGTRLKEGDLPDDMLKNCLRIGWIVETDAAQKTTARPAAQDPAPKPPPKPAPKQKQKPAPAAKEETTQEPQEAFDWTQTPVEELDIPDDVVPMLLKARLQTVGDVLKYGTEHNGLTDLKGVGQATESLIRDAIQKLKDG